MPLFRSQVRDALMWGDSCCLLPSPYIVTANQQLHHPDIKEKALFLKRKWLWIEERFKELVPLVCCPLCPCLPHSYLFLMSTEGPGRPPFVLSSPLELVSEVHKAWLPFCPFLPQYRPISEVHWEDWRLFGAGALLFFRIWSSWYCHISDL